jgi:hypothetical protein
VINENQNKIKFLYFEIQKYIIEKVLILIKIQNRIIEDLSKIQPEEILENSMILKITDINDVTNNLNSNEYDFLISNLCKTLMIFQNLFQKIVSKDVFKLENFENKNQVIEFHDLFDLYLSNFENIILDKFSELFLKNIQNPYWKWIYGSLSLLTSKLNQILSSMTEDDENTDLIKYSEKIQSILFKYTQIYDHVIEKINSEYYQEEKIENHLVEEGNEIKHAKLYSLIDILIENKRQNFRDQFFLTYRSFTTSYYLLNDLIYRYNSIVYQKMKEEIKIVEEEVEEEYISDEEEDENVVQVENLDLIKKKSTRRSLRKSVKKKIFINQNFKKFPEKKLTLLDESNEKKSIIIINTLKYWINSYFYDFDCISIIMMIRFLTNEVSKIKNLTTISQILLTRIETSLLNINMNFIVSMNKMPASIIPKKINKFSLLDWNPIEIARQITIIEYEIFEKIKENELFDLSWSKKDKNEKSPNICALINRLNQLSMWFVTNLVSIENLKERTAYMKLIIQIANELKILQNYNGLNAIISSLNNSSVRRLKKTFMGLSKKELLLIEELNSIVSNNTNYKKHRECIEFVTSGCIPFLGMFLTDLTFIGN